MPRPVYDVTLTYTKDGQEVNETYKSIIELAKAYKTTNFAISNYLNGERKTSPLPEGYKITLARRTPVTYKKDGYLLWHCDLCDIEILAGSKTNHLRGPSHKKLAHPEDYPSEPNTEVVPHFWRCDVCDVEILAKSKYNHLNGVHHKLLVKERNDKLNSI